jgi:hypothetical protein
MSAPCKEDPDLDESVVYYEPGQKVQVVGGNRYLGHSGKITAVDRHVYVELENGVHLNGAFTLFKLVK